MYNTDQILIKLVLAILSQLKHEQYVQILQGELNK
jgi:hypothetical protein